MKRLEQRVALITGAGSGIGKATALMMAEEGAAVALLDREPDRIDEVAAAVRGLGGRALALAADVSDPEAMRRAVAAAAAEWARLDIVFANAGINGVTAPLDEIEPEEWDQVMAVNLRGPFLTLKYAIPHLRRQGGAIVLNASGQGTRTYSVPGTTAYACTKSALSTMGKKLALELARDRIRVNIVCPGSTDTDINASKFSRSVDRIALPIEFPQGKVLLTGGKKATPEQVAKLVLFLASDDADMITGTEVWIDGAMSLMQG
jgi:NAD(P)-dependent dehydrogenase (short-subunit alcohol dehydrogenase family)